ncbi:MAG: nucleoside deaminase [Arenicellales bacterium]
MHRRKVLGTCGLSALWLAHQLPAQGAVEQEKKGPISQPHAPATMKFIERAFEMRRRAIEYGDQPYGAIIVINDVIVGQSWSRVILDQDPTAHAEISAIRDTAQRLASRNLSGAIMYSSSAPCPMCEAAAYWAGIQRLIYGPKGKDAGAPRLCG